MPAETAATPAATGLAWRWAAADAVATAAVLGECDDAITGAATAPSPPVVDDDGLSVPPPPAVAAAGADDAAAAASRRFFLTSCAMALPSAESSFHGGAAVTSLNRSSLFVAALLPDGSANNLPGGGSGAPATAVDKGTSSDAAGRDARPAASPPCSSACSDAASASLPLTTLSTLGNALQGLR